MHKVADQIQNNISIPLLHIADATILTLKKDKINKVGLLGKKYTLTQDFYKQKIINEGIDVLIPNNHDINVLILFYCLHNYFVNSHIVCIHSIIKCICKS